MFICEHEAKSHSFNHTDIHTHTRTNTLFNFFASVRKPNSKSNSKRKNLFALRLSQIIRSFPKGCFPPFLLLRNWMESHLRKALQRRTRKAAVTSLTISSSLHPPPPQPLRNTHPHTHCRPLLPIPSLYPPWDPHKHRRQ